MNEEVLAGGTENPGHVVRVGDTVRRPRKSGSVIVEALLVHLETFGFGEAPRFHGVDEQGRQVLSYLEGTASDPAPWQHDDAANADHLGRLASVLARLHDATATFTPPPGAVPRRSLALAGEVWTHADMGYSNIVYCDGELVGLIDWEFAAPGHRCCDLAAMLAMSVRGPKLGADDHARRERAVTSALTAIADNYGLGDNERSDLPAMAAMVIDDAVAHWQAAAPRQSFDAWHWRADWFRECDVAT